MRVIGLIRLRIGIIGEPLWMRHWKSGFHKPWSYLTGRRSLDRPSGRWEYNIRIEFKKRQSLWQIILIQHRVGIISELLWIRNWTFRLYKPWSSLTLKEMWIQWIMESIISLLHREIPRRANHVSRAKSHKRSALHLHHRILGASREETKHSPSILNYKTLAHRSNLIHWVNSMEQKISGSFP